MSGGQSLHSKPLSSCELLTIILPTHKQSQALKMIACSMLQCEL
jgi:hypothetical protein